jgi:hypothetical protein
MSTAGSIALILLIIEALVLLIIPLAIAAGLVYAMHRLRGFLARAMPKAQAFATLVNTRTRQIADAVVDPVMRAQTAPDHLRASARAARRRGSQRWNRWLGRASAPPPA